ncbi:Hypothetical_protein [Hexamita inflata]|uniref:Hypothetical_protein n=1 Tax=Hexamita inflata TaxID=28002 RepID=A0AA86NDX5_9EUKA|nr:Hypothetical protein HINF_LOCUS5018 [Hexamita inflata]
MELQPNFRILQIYIVTLIFRQSKYKSQVIQLRLPAQLSSIRSECTCFPRPQELCFGIKFVCDYNIRCCQQTQNYIQQFVAKASLRQRATRNSRTCAGICLGEVQLDSKQPFVSQFTVRSSRTFARSNEQAQTQIVVRKYSSSSEEQSVVRANDLRPQYVFEAQLHAGCHLDSNVQVFYYIISKFSEHEAEVLFSRRTNSKELRFDSQIVYTNHIIFILRENTRLILYMFWLTHQSLFRTLS